MTDPIQHQLSACADVANIRPATLGGREFIVVPVVMAIGDSVVRPMGSTGPVFMPAKELAASVREWDGRPVVDDHPDRGESRANTPENIAKFAYGQCFNTSFTDNRLRTEAFIDVAKAAALGGTAQDNVNRIKRHEMIGVSVGPFAKWERKSGISPSGVPYEFIEHDIVPDHLAFLPAGTVPACSIEMGCGAPRVASKEDDNVGKEKPDKDALGEFFRRMWQPIFSKSRLIAAQGESDVELRDLLWAALRDTVLGFEDIREVVPDESIVRYSVFTETDQHTAFWQQGYTVADGVVTLADGRVQVEPTTEWKPVGDTVAASSSEDTDDNEQPKGEVEMPKEPDEKVVALAAQLIAHEQSPFTEDDSDTLTAFSETRLTEMLTCCGELKPAAKVPVKSDMPDVKPPAVDDTTDDDSVKLSRDDYNQMRAAAQAHQERTEQDKVAVVESIKGNDRVNDVYSESELKAMSLVELHKVAKLVGSTEQLQPAASNYAGITLPIETKQPNDTAPPPPDMTALIKANRAAAN